MQVGTTGFRGQRLLVGIAHRSKPCVASCVSAHASAHRLAGSAGTAHRKAHIAYGLASGELYDLMFHRDAVHADDPDLFAARQRALEPLLRATGPGLAAFSGHPVRDACP